jgi:hypothetical protein
MDTSCCQSEEDHCADLRVSTDALGNGGKDGMAACPAEEEEAEVDAVRACGQRSGGRVSVGGMLDLQDLLAIVLDVMNDKQAADKRCVVSAAA